MPFAALRERAAKRLLIESHPLAVAPSATLSVHAVERQRADSRRPPGRGLVIGDPAVNRRFFSELGSLGESAKEAELVAGGAARRC